MVVSNNLSMDLIMIYERMFFSTCSATKRPEIKEGGTPGPGTVNCPVKKRFFTFLLLMEGFFIAV